MSDFEDQAWVKMGVAGALEQEYLKDQGFFLELLAKTLGTALPDETSLKTKGLLKKTCVGVQVSLGDARYSFEKPDRGPVIALKTKVVRGIALKTEEIPVAEALQELGEAMEQRAAKSGQAREAMAKMLGLE
ncbi:MAG TPA: hypothetical protein VGL56_17375 [Fimbriimonadaceae bacterium]|jgi:hypothetical protein